MDKTVEELQLIAFQMISHLGMAKGKFMEAINSSEAHDEAKADTLMEEGNQELVQAHKSHFELIQDEANGKKLPFSLILMHAEDQLMTVEMFKEIGLKLIKINLKLN